MPVPPDAGNIHSFCPRVAMMYLPSGVQMGDSYVLVLPLVSWTVSFLSMEIVNRL